MSEWNISKNEKKEIIKIVERNRKNDVENII